MVEATALGSFAISTKGGHTPHGTAIQVIDALQHSLLGLHPNRVRFILQRPLKPRVPDPLEVTGYSCLLIIVSGRSRRLRWYVVQRETSSSGWSMIG
jgi:hypothetical protein